MIAELIQSFDRRVVLRERNRVDRPFEWGLEFFSTDGGGLGESGSARAGREARMARQAVFEFNDWAINNSHSFFGCRCVTAYTFDGHWLSFKSPITTPYPENNVAYARFFPARPGARWKDRTSKVDPSRSQGRVVVVLPQWNADFDSHVAICRLFNRAGVAALRLSLPYHDRRMAVGCQRADYLVSPNIGRTLQACRQAVLDTRAAIGWLRQQGYDRIGLLGTSIGSCISFLTFVHDQRVSVAVLNLVSSYFGDVVWEGITTAHLKKCIEPVMTREELRRAWAAISPNSYVGRMAGNPRPTLFISARYDMTFTPRLSQLLFDECNRHGVKYDLRTVPCGHYTIGRPPFRYYVAYLVLNYIRRHL